MRPSNVLSGEIVKCHGAMSKQGFPQTSGLIFGTFEGLMCELEKSFISAVSLKHDSWIM